MAAVADPSGQRQRYIPDLLDVHAEELAYLWGRRRASLLSDSLNLRHLAALNERIEAHTQGLLVAPEALERQFAVHLGLQDRDAAFAAAHALLRSGLAGVQLVMDAVPRAQPEGLAGMRDALCIVDVDAAEAALRALLECADAAVAATAAYVLATHRRLDPASPRLESLLMEPEPAIALLAWKVVALLGDSASAPPRPYKVALQDESAAIRDAALRAAIWQGLAWAPATVRRLAEAQDPVALPWLSATAGPEALPFFQALTAADSRSCAVVRQIGRYGHPALCEPLLDMLNDADPQLSEAAGAAFMRMAGVALAGERRAIPLDENADEFAREFGAESYAVDAAQARELWQRKRETWLTGSRWCRGWDISLRLSKEARQEIDLEALWDFGARAALCGHRSFGPPSDG